MLFTFWPTFPIDFLFFNGLSVGLRANKGNIRRKCNAFGQIVNTLPFILPFFEIECYRSFGADFLNRCLSVAFFILISRNCKRGMCLSLLLFRGGHRDALLFLALFFSSF